MREAPAFATSAVERGRGALGLLTFPGAVATSGAVGGLILGFTQRWQELVVIGLVCLLALLVALAWTWGRVALAVDFALHRSRVTAGQPASGRVLLRNTARRFVFPAVMELAVGKGRAEFTLPALDHDEEFEQLFDIPTSRRGVIQVGPVSSVRTDPLHLMRRVQQWSESVDLFVHPVTVPLANDSAGYLRDVEGVTTQDLSSSDVSFHALREYVPGDDRRAIHWRTTARVGKLMVRQFEETRRSHLLIVLPTGLASYADEHELELAVSVAGSLARHAFQEERECTVYVDGGALRSDNAMLMLDRLAEIEVREGTTLVRDLARRAVTEVPHASVCALLAGSETDVSDLRAAHKRLPGAVTTFALRCSRGGALNRRRIGDLTMLDVPELTALPRAMRSVA